MKIPPLLIDDFVAESNRIEGIHREPSSEEVMATIRFVNKGRLTIDDFVELVGVYVPGHRLREMAGLNVRVGRYIAPAGGPEIRTSLERIIADAMARERHPWEVHIDYERLHPFTDGNGRSGRALWLWMMPNATAPLGFLHHFYYQTLERDHMRVTAGKK